MELDRDTCYRALSTRDARFDGRFFTAVRTTGVYCRPICPARTPKLENCTFMPCAAAAQEAGYRPCLRCRPETAPGTPAWSGTSATVSRALRLIDEGALDTDTIEALADRLGLGGRQLRRLFHEHVGASPVAVAQTRRVLLAKRLLDETDMRVGDVAFATGFGSVRRFNDAFRRAIGRPPSAVRRATKARAKTPPDNTACVTIRLAYRPPMPFDALLNYLTRRAIPGVERVAGDAYRRTIAVGEAVGIVEVTQEPLRHELCARLFLSAPANLARIGARLRRQFDLGADPVAIAAHLQADPLLHDAVQTRPGLRVPGAWDPFELGVRAILGQQVTVAGASRLTGRLVSRFGTPLPDAPATAIGDGLTHLFPTAQALADRDLAVIGIPAARARTIATFAAAVADDPALLEPEESLDAFIDKLCALPGMGRWTAHYIALRALGEPDAFPSGDLGLRRAAGRDGPVVSAKALEAMAAPWRPWRGYAAMYLWTGSGAPGAVEPNGSERTS